MKTVVIAVGKELLTGRTVNLNLRDISMKLKQIGIDVNRSFVIDDIKEEYKKILDFIDEDLIIFTGGLGPTVDDITREVVYEYFGVDTYINEEEIEYIRNRFGRMGLKMKDTNIKQAVMPKESIVLHNELGTAPGVYFKVNGKRIALFPGPPHEMNPLMDMVQDTLKEELDIKLFTKGFKLVGTGESYMESKLTNFYQEHSKVNIAPYANVGEIKYIFTSSDQDALDQCMNEFKFKFSQFIYGDLDDTLESVIVKELIQRGLTVSFAESCTGGLIASTIVNVSGSSNVFKESFVTYSNEAKQKYLGVSKETLEKYGAVSEECAIEMSKGLSNQTNADISLSVTGIAGPTGGTEEKPVGLVHFGLTYKGKTVSYRRVFNGNRLMVRTRAKIYGLNLIRGVLNNGKNDY